MTFKQLENDQIKRTIEWNEIRGNYTETLDWNLEIDMLQEELNELKLAVEKSSNVDIFDALLDLKFVLIGSLGKMGLSYKDVINGYEFVLQKNETKSKTKDSNGKITKPIGFVGPEKDLQKIKITWILLQNVRLRKNHWLNILLKKSHMYFFIH